MRDKEKRRGGLALIWVGKRKKKKEGTEDQERRGKLDPVPGFFNKSHRNNNKQSFLVA